MHAELVPGFAAIRRRGAAGGGSAAADGGKSGAAVDKVSSRGAAAKLEVARAYCHLAPPPLVIDCERLDFCCDEKHTNDLQNFRG